MLILSLLDEAMAAGARQRAACEILNISERMVQRWRKLDDGGEDRRSGPTEEPANQLSKEEREEIIKVATCPEFRDLSPRQIVPRLAV